MYIYIIYIYIYITYICCAPEAYGRWLAASARPSSPDASAICA